LITYQGSNGQLFIPSLIFTAYFAGVRLVVCRSSIHFLLDTSRCQSDAWFIDARLYKCCVIIRCLEILMHTLNNPALINLLDSFLGSGRLLQWFSNKVMNSGVFKRLNPWINVRHQYNLPPYHS
jgi:hypothetical protein